MQSRVLAHPSKLTGTEEYSARSLGNDLADLAETPQIPNRAARGIMLGIFLGVSLWATILVFAGVIKL